MNFSKLLHLKEAFWSKALVRKPVASRGMDASSRANEKMFLGHLNKLLKTKRYDVLISELDDPKNKKYAIPDAFRIRAYRRAGLRKEAVALGEKVFNATDEKDSELTTEYLWSLVSIGEMPEALSIALDFAKETEIEGQSMGFIHVLLRLLYSNGNMKDILKQTSEYLKSGKTSSVLHAYRAGAAFEEKDLDVYASSIELFKLEGVPPAHINLKKNLFLYRVTELLKAERLVELIAELDDPRNEKYSIPATLRIRAYRRAHKRKKAVELSEKKYDSAKKKSAELVTEYLWSLVSVGEIQKALPIALSFVEESEIESQSMGFIHVLLRVLYSNGRMKDILTYTERCIKFENTSSVLQAYRAGAAFKENDMEIFAGSIGCFKLESLPPAHFALKRELFDNFENNSPTAEKGSKLILRSSLRFAGLDNEEEVATNVHITEERNRDDRGGNEDTNLHEDDSFRSRYIFDLLKLAETGKKYPVGINERIPKTVIQFWHETDNIPEDVKKCLESWDNLEARGYTRLLFNDNQARTFIKKKLGKTYLQAFERCHQPAMRCDYFRLCYLFLNGGFYLDADELFQGGDYDQFFFDSNIKLQPLCYDLTNNINIPYPFVTKKTHDASRIYYFANSPIICPRFHPLVSLALERATRKLLETSSRLEIQSTTGPVNLTVCVVKYAMDCRISLTQLDLRVIEDWEAISISPPLSYRADKRNWRNANP